MKKINFLFFPIVALFLVLGFGCNNKTATQIVLMNDTVSVDTGNFASIVDYVKSEGEDASTSFLLSYILRKGEMKCDTNFENIEFSGEYIIHADKFIKNDSVFHVTVTVGDFDSLTNNMKKMHYSYYIQDNNIVLASFDSTQGEKKHFISEMEKHYETLMDEYVNEDNN